MFSLLRADSELAQELKQSEEEKKELAVKVKKSYDKLPDMEKKIEEEVRFFFFLFSFLSYFMIY